MCVCVSMRVCVRVLNFEKIQRLYLMNYSAHQIEIWYEDKAKISLSSV